MNAVERANEVLQLFTPLAKDNECAIKCAIAYADIVWLNKRLMPYETNNDTLHWYLTIKVLEDKLKDIKQHEQR
jgi:hypothetical protein